MDNNNGCVKEKIKPWFVGLGVIIIIVFGWIIFGKKENKIGVFDERMLVGKTKLNQPTPTIPVRTRQDSYRNIVEQIKPAVVGISLPGAQPFLQGWNQQAAPQVPVQQQAGGFGNNTLRMPCPNCGTVVNRQQGAPLTAINCPNCRAVVPCPIINGNVQQQAMPQGVQPWTQITGQQVQAQTQTQIQKEEYLLCPNCGIKLNQTPGIPWSNAKCPGCGTVMAHMIKETDVMDRDQQPNNTGGNQVALQCPGACPGCPLGTPQASGQPVAFHTPGCPYGTPQQVAQQQVAQPGFQGMGSGLIVSKKGYILTSSHFVSGVNTVNVTLFAQSIQAGTGTAPQSQQSFTGQVIARAVDRDLAIIQIDPKNIDLPVVRIGNSDSVQMGSTVLAFGNPFGLSQTVTSGIVGAVRKSIVIEGQQLNNVIQTDAPINSGSCGGPLVNSRGEVIGINTVIFSPSQTYTGLGFAIPINQAKEVFANYMDLSQNGGVSAQNQSMQYLDYNKPPQAYPVAATAAVNEDMPVWLGLSIQVLNDIIGEQLNIPVDSGILINEVYQNSPASSVGIQKGDVIIRLDGRRITDETQIRALLFEKKPGDKVNLTILRGRKRFDVTIDTAGGAFQQQAALNQNVPGQVGSVPVKKKPNLLKGSEIETGSAELTTIGIAAITITPEIAFSYGLPENTQGVIATETEGLSLKYGLKDGDIIQGVNGKATPDLLSYLKAVKRGDLIKGVTFSVVRKGQLMEFIIKEPPQLLPKGL